MSWVDEKAHAELARIRKAKRNQVYPYFREFQTGGLHTTIVNFSSNDYLTHQRSTREESRADVGLSSLRRVSAPSARSHLHFC